MHFAEGHSPRGERVVPEIRFDAQRYQNLDELAIRVVWGKRRS